MPQYRVRCRITFETLIDLVAPTPADAMKAAAEMCEQDGHEVIPIAAELIAGQFHEPEIPQRESRYSAALQGEEDGA